MERRLVITGLFFVLLSIVLGAFGAHGLKKIVSLNQIVSFEVGVRYQMYHGILFLILSLLHNKFTVPKIVFRLIFLGLILFSGSIYLLSLKDLLSINYSFLGIVTPIGGLCMIIGWSIYLINILRLKSVE
jgi:uncharacterized membrane protein YgdD (TMEM256/DUF423 family)